MPRGSPPKAETEAGRVKPLSGGNPQIAKGDGDAPTRAYIAAMPVWKSGIGRRIDEIIVREVPGVLPSGASRGTAASSAYIASPSISR
jgi:hypothetical protein